MRDIWYRHGFSFYNPGVTYVTTPYHKRSYIKWGKAVGFGQPAPLIRKALWDRNAKYQIWKHKLTSRVDVPTFQEVGLGDAKLPAASKAGEAERNIWGALSSILTKVTGSMERVEMAKLEEEVARTRPLALPFGLPTGATPNVALVVGGAALLGVGAYFALSQRRR